MLDATEHGLTLPPRGVIVPVEVRQQSSAATERRVRRVADVAGARRSRLHAVLLRRGAAHVGRDDGVIEGDVLELGHAAAGVSLVIVT